jgi:hypothetical protein
MRVQRTPNRERNETVGTGTMIDARPLVTIGGDHISVPAPDALVHLQFRRFAGCPLCDLHLRSFVQRHDEIVAAGVREVVVFHSTSDDLLDHEAHLPFAVVADPDKLLYVAFGVESAPRALLDPQVWVPILRAVARRLWAIIRRQRRAPALNPRGGRLGLPADFLIAPDGRVLASHYGTHAYDQWSVDELLDHARSPALSRASSAPTMAAARDT